MQDGQIIELFFERSEQALYFVKEKYNAYLFRLAKNILGSREDAEECVNDAYLKTWNSIPPNTPISLCAYMAKITRNIALNISKAKAVQKRGGGLKEVYNEIDLIVSSPDFADKSLDNMELKNALDSFLDGLKKEHRIIFLKRYWYFEKVTEISSELKLSESKVKSVLSRLRKKLQKHLLNKGEFIYD